MMRHYTLYTAAGSPASNKIRSFLRWRNIAFKERPATAELLRTMIRPRLRSVEVPVLATPTGDLVHDTRLIIDAIEAREPGDRLIPPHAHQRFACRLIEAFGDEWFAPALVSERWYECPHTAAGEIARSVYPDLAPEVADRQSRILCELLGGKLGARGFRHDRRPDTQARLERFLDALEHHLSHHAYLFGGRPSSADFSLFGALSIDFEAVTGGVPHTESRPAIRRWMALMNAPWSLDQGEYRRAYELPPSLMALLRLISDRFIPEAVATAKAVADWADGHPGQPVLPDRVAAEWVEDVADRHTYRPEIQWLFQRALAPIRGEMSAAEVRARDTLLQGLECDFLRDYAPRRRLVRDHHLFRAEINRAETGERDDRIARNVSQLLDRAEKAAQSSRELADLLVG
ncbi:glutathione S-transferase family protein [Maricaulis sp. CAU 1757]